MIQCKRIYEPRNASDGYRILVDRVWPRGMSKRRAHLDLWLKDVAPSTTLRKWFGHIPERWTEFKHRYTSELKGSEALKELRQLCRSHKTVTLLYGAKDEAHNQAVALLGVLKRGRKT